MPYEPLNVDMSAHINDRHIELNSNLYVRCTKHTCQQMYKILNDMSPKQLNILEPRQPG